MDEQKERIDVVLNSALLLEQSEIKSLTNSSYLPVVHGKMTDALASMSSRQLVKDKMSGGATLETNEVKLKLDKFMSSTINLGPATHKLFMAGLNEFVKNNHISKRGGQLSNYRTAIKLADFATVCGYDVTPKETMSAEAEEKEKARITNVLDNFRKKVQKSLNLLYMASFSWEEKINGKVKNFADIRIIGAKGISNGMIVMEFSVSAGEYIASLPLTQYPTALFAIDDRNPNAYRIGCYLARRYSIPKNHEDGTADRCKVNSILGVTLLPAIEDLKDIKQGWEARIKEPLEKALESLVKDGLLKEWSYVGRGGTPLSDKEAVFDNWDEWRNALVKFEFKKPFPLSELKPTETPPPKTPKKRPKKKPPKTEA